MMDPDLFEEWAIEECERRDITYEEFLKELEEEEQARRAAGSPETNDDPSPFVVD